MVSLDTASWMKASALLVLVLLSGFFSSSESALFTLGFHRVRRLKSTARRSYEAARALLSQPTKLISTLLTGNEVVNAAIGIVGSSLVYGLFHHSMSQEMLALMSVACVLPVVLFFGEILPKTLGVKHPETVTTLNAPLLYWFFRIIGPIRDGLSWLSQKVLALTGSGKGDHTEVSEEVFRSMVDVGTEEGVLDAHEQRLIHNVFRLDDVQVKQFMTSAKKVSYLTIDMSTDEVLAQIKEDQYSRFPVLDAKEKKVVGTLYTKDLLGHRIKSNGTSIQSLVRPPLTIPNETNALHLFALFRNKRTHFGIVCGASQDEMVGVVTLEDVLEQIFGAIRDERDVEEGRPSKR